MAKYQNGPVLQEFLGAKPDLPAIQVGRDEARGSSKYEAAKNLDMDLVLDVVLDHFFRLIWFVLKCLLQRGPGLRPGPRPSPRVL